MKWALFAVWVVYCILAFVLAFLAKYFGGGEQGALTWLALGWQFFLLSLLVGGLLMWTKHIGWLALLTLGMCGICVYNGCGLLRLMG